MLKGRRNSSSVGSRVALSIFVMLVPSCNSSTDQDGARGHPACTSMNGGPRPFPPLPPGANGRFIRAGGDTSSLHDSFTPVWGRVCVQNGANSRVVVQVAHSDGTSGTLEVLSGACADMNTSAATLKGGCTNAQDAACQIYTYTMSRKCYGDPKPTIVEVEPHVAYALFRFDVNPSAYEFMTAAKTVRASGANPTIFLSSASLANVEICPMYGAATLVASFDEAGVGTNKREYLLSAMPKCFVAQGRNLAVRLNPPYPPSNTPALNVLTYRMLSYR